MKKKIYSLLALLPLTATMLSAQATLSDTLLYTGGIQTFTVPCGITSIHIDAYGASGADGATGGNSATGGIGGAGGVVSGDLAVTPGQIINVFVGGQAVGSTGGFNGGANGGSTNAGGGGGATDIRVNGTSLADRVLTAGGGGGGGRAGCESNTVAGGNGGDGNGITGANGTDAPTSNGVAGGGFGGTISAGGAAGIGCSGFLGAPGVAGTLGNGGVGGAGQSCCCFTFASIPGGGGGGGGFNGGGGGGGGSAGTTGCSGNDKGAGGGGAGGSCNTAGVTNGLISSSTNTGDGWVVITYADQTPVLPFVSAPATVCAGVVTTLTITNNDPNATFYTWTVPSGLTFISGQNTNTITVGTGTPGTYTIDVTPMNTCVGAGPTASVSLTVNALPSVAAAAAPTTYCTLDANGILIGTPAGGTFSGPGVTGSIFNPSTAGVGVHNVVYSFTDANGCTNADTIPMTVNACTGIAQNELDASIDLYPNPVKGNLNITVNKNVGDMTIEIADIEGRIVYSSNEKNVQAGFTKQISMEKYPNGNYVVYLKANGQQASHKVTVQK